MNNTTVIAFDTDGTLIHQNYDLEDTPRYDVIINLRSIC